MIFDVIVEEEAARTVFLVWGIIGLLVTLALFGAMVLYATKKTAEYGSETFLLATTITTSVYALLSTVWWFGMHHHSSTVPRSLGIV